MNPVNLAFFSKIRAPLLFSSLILFILSFLGPEGTPIKGLIYNLDFFELFNVLSSSSESIFRTPNTILRFTVFSISLFFIFICYLIHTDNSLPKHNDNNDLYSILILLFIATNIITANIANILYILIIILSLYYFIKYKTFGLSLPEKTLLGLNFSLFFFSVYSASIHDANIREIDVYFRFLLAIPLYLFIRSIDINIDKVINFIHIASILSGVFALYFAFFDNQSRVYGFTSTATTYGNISFLFALLSLITFFYLKKNNKNIVISLLSIVFAIMAWSLTNNRANLFSLIFVFIIFLHPIIRVKLDIYFKQILLFTIFILLVIWQSGTLSRILSGYDDIMTINSHENIETSWKDTGSIKPRLIIWQASLNMIHKSPIIGIGLDNFNIELENQIINDHIPMIRKSDMNQSGGFNHAHNQYLDSFAKTGLFGFILLVIYLISYFMYFYIHLKKSSDESHLIATLGLITVFIYIFNMFSHSIFSHHQSTLFFIFILTMFSAIISRNKLSKL